MNENVKYNKAGIKSSGLKNCSSWSYDLMETLPDSNEWDPITAKEEDAKLDEYRAQAEAMKKLLPALLGEQNYVRWQLTKKYGLNSIEVGEHLGLADSTIRKSIERCNNKLDELARLVGEFEDLNDSIWDMKEAILKKRPKEEPVD